MQQIRLFQCSKLEGFSFRPGREHAGLNDLNVEHRENTSEALQNNTKIICESPNSGFMIRDHS